MRNLTIGRVGLALRISLAHRLYRTDDDDDDEGGRLTLFVSMCARSNLPSSRRLARLPSTRQIATLPNVFVSVPDCRAASLDCHIAEHLSGCQIAEPHR